MGDDMRLDHLPILIAIPVLGAGLLIFLTVRTFANWVNLDWTAAVSLLTGIIGFVVSMFFVLVRDFSLSKLFPWMLCVFYPFILPALNYWSLDMPSRLFFRIDESMGNVDRLWYGNGWWQLLIFIGLVACAYGWHRLHDDRY